MPSSDTNADADTGRRRVLAAAGGLLTLLAGCTGGPAGGRSTATPSATPTRTPTPTVTATGTYGDLPDGPRAYPDRPADLTTETVREYVHDVEHARTHNVLYEPDMADSSVQCQTVYDAAAHGGHYALATCTGYANYPEAHADWGQTPALYFVAPDLTVRVADYDDRYFHCTDVFAAEDPSENFAAVCEGGDAAYRVYNMHTEPHDVSVTVEFRGEDADETVLEREHALAPTAGVEQGSVTYRRGVYLVTATLDTGVEATYRWDLQSPSLTETPHVTVLVTPAGGLDVRRVPYRTVRS